MQLLSHNEQRNALICLCARTTPLALPPNIWFFSRKQLNTFTLFFGGTNPYNFQTKPLFGNTSRLQWRGACSRLWMLGTEYKRVIQPCALFEYAYSFGVFNVTQSYSISQSCDVKLSDAPDNWQKGVDFTILAREAKYCRVRGASSLEGAGYCTFEKQ